MSAPTKPLTASVIGWALKRRFTEVVKVRWVPSKNAQLCLCLGDNATGKSLFRRIVRGWCQKNEKQKVEMIGLSMQDRAGGMMGIAHAFVYGDEHLKATGVNTGHTVTTAISTARSRERRNIVFWDEPDTGLSDAYAAGVGQRIADFALDSPPHTVATFVVSHRKVLVEQLLRAKPHILFFGENAPNSVEEYLKAPVVPADLEELYDRSLKLLRAVNQLEKKA